MPSKLKYFNNTASAITRSMQRMAIVVVVLLSVLVIPGLAVATADSVAPNSSQSDQLKNESYRLWQLLNQARNNPSATTKQLGLSVSEVRDNFTDQPGMFVRGLFPLSWSDDLSLSAYQHGRDMFDRLYYSYTSPEGDDPLARILNTGYQAQNGDETLAVLLFSQLIDVKTVVDNMLQMMLRDELTAREGVPRNIFSAAPEEVGIAFFAESVPALAGQPYVYLLVLDFARPVESHYVITGVTSPGTIIKMRNTYSGFVEYVSQLPAATYQVAYPEGGATLASFDSAGELLTVETVYEPIATHNHYLDLRGD